MDLVSARYLSGMANGNGLASVNHIVVLMLENRSFDHMLGYLYPGNVTPSGQPFEGLAGTESNPDSNGQPVDRDDHTERLSHAGR
jgi:phospholipase C